MFGIKVVWAGWTGDDRDGVIGLSDYAARRWLHSLDPGTRALIYEASKPRPGYGKRGIMSIVGEVEIIGAAVEETPLSPKHPHLLRVRVLHPRAEVSPIPLPHIRAVIGDPLFPRQGESWMPLSEAVYRRLLAELVGG